MLPTCVMVGDWDWPSFCRAARAEVGSLEPNHHPPVVVVPGATTPRLAGRRWGWTNRSGEPIRHPRAYAKRGWSSLVYRASTLRVEVGADWRPAGGAA
jgi:hypothetical protein